MDDGRIEDTVLPTCTCTESLEIQTIDGLQWIWGSKGERDLGLKEN